MLLVVEIFKKNTLKCKNVSTLIFPAILIFNDEWILMTDKNNR